MLISLHTQAATTLKSRAAIQASTEPAWMVAERYGISEQTVCKWRKRYTVHDRRPRPRFRRLTPTSASWLNVIERFFAEIPIRIADGASIPEETHKVFDPTV